MAISADPKNPLAKFERANVLLSMDRLDEALAELQVLKVRPCMHPCAMIAGADG